VPLATALLGSRRDNSGFGVIENYMKVPDKKFDDISEQDLELTQDQILELKRRIKDLENLVRYGKMGDVSHKGFEVRWEPARDSKGNPLCLQKVDPFIFRPIEYVQITGSCSFEISEFPLQNGCLGGVRVAWATGEFLGKEALLVASKIQSAVTKISITNENVSLESPTCCST
jgi:hypothetical protein